MTSAASRLPAWVVLHVPHDSMVVPDEVRAQFVLSDEALRDELVRMTDHHTFALFAGHATGTGVVRAQVSRLVVDVERFEDDAREPMAACGMGAVYVSTSQGAPLRRPLSADERKALLHAWYRPHHRAFEAAVSRALDAFGRCLVIDCHSFPSVALPYERAEAEAVRPEVCIGTDAFHTGAGLAEAFVAAFEAAGFTVARDTPFAGAIVPASRYRSDRRVAAVMVEVNRGLYCDETDGTMLSGFEETAQRVQAGCDDAIERATKGRA